MALTINTNVASVQAQKNIATAQSNLSVSFNRLSSGFRINSAKDDAAGLAISESMKSKIRTYTVVERNTNDAVSMAQTADGALGQVSDILGRMRELAAQGSNGSLQSADRLYLQTEFKSLQSEVKRIMTGTTFNGQKLISSSASTVNFQVGIDNNAAADRIAVTFGGLNIGALTTSTLSLSGAAASSQNALDTIDTSLKTVSTARSKYGALMNRLDVVTSNIQTSRLNLMAANSRIRDVDVAEEAAQLARQQVIMQAGMSVLAQANQSPQQILGLLR